MSAFYFLAIDFLPIYYSGMLSGKQPGASGTMLGCVVAAGAHTFDLRELGSEPFIRYDNTNLDLRGSTFSFSACGDVTPTSEGGSCAEELPSAVLRQSEGDCAGLGRAATRTVAITSQGLALSFSGDGSHCSGSNEVASTTIIVECADVPQPVVVRWGGEEASCSFVALVGARAGCPTMCGRNSFGAICGGEASGVCTADGGAMASARCICKQGRSGKACEYGEYLTQKDIVKTPLTLATFGMWASTDDAMDLLWMLSDVMFRATGRALTPVNSDLSQADALAIADVIYIGVFEDRAASSKIARQFKSTAITIFFGSENTDNSPFDDQMVGEVAISLGHRRVALTASAGSNGGAYLRFPWWLPYTVRRETGACQLPPAFSTQQSATDWLARPGFTALLSSHKAYPRQLLFDLVMTLGHVDAAGKAFHNAEWPAGLPNHHQRGKIEYLRGYRFTICPENSRTRGIGGYNTEKLTQAHLAGAVPIYWGDAIDIDVFNLARVILFDGSNTEEVLNIMKRLQEDAEFRDAWFEQPILASTAGEWMKAWCANATRLFRDAAGVLQT